MADPDALGRVLARLPGAPALISFSPLGEGHIHHTYRVEARDANRERSLVLQRLNLHVFPDVSVLAANHRRVSEALAGADFAVPELLSFDHGDAICRLEPGQVWRAMTYVPGTCLQVVDSPDRAFAAARAFAQFAGWLVREDPRTWPDVLPGFHHTPDRVAALDRVWTSARRQQQAECRAEYDFVGQWRTRGAALSHALARGELPLRMAHNDAKLNNLLFAPEGRRVVGLLDLDTVMPGTPLVDLGDLLRTASTRAAEDEPDLARVCVDPDLVAALIEGYKDGGQDWLTPDERTWFLPAAATIAFETGVRFLTDHLNGDAYFKTCRPGQNLDRCRVQFRIAAQFLTHMKK